MNTRIKIKAKTMNLNRDDVQELCSIVNKAIGEDSKQRINLRMSGGNEDITSNDIGDFIKARWPANVDEINLSARCHETGREIEFWFDNDLFGVQRIYVSGSEPDWVSARTKEIEGFIEDHRNCHWIFAMPFFVVFSLSTLVLLTLVIWKWAELDMPEEGAGAVPVVMSVALFFALSPLARIFPFINVETNRPSGRKSLRKFLKWLIPSLFITLIAGVILNAIGVDI